MYQEQRTSQGFVRTGDNAPNFIRPLDYMWLMDQIRGPHNLIRLDNTQNTFYSVIPDVPVPREIMVAALERFVKPYGPMLPTWINTTLKTVFADLARMYGPDRIPEYPFSAQTIDAALLGHEPSITGTSVHHGRYLDTSRAGPEVCSLVKSYETYTARMIQKLRSSPDRLIHNWILQYGLGCCIPVALITDVIQQTLDHDGRLYMVPATSVAEAFKAIKAKYLNGNGGFNPHTDPHLANKNTEREKASGKLIEIFERWLQEDQILACTGEPRNRLLRQLITNPHSVTETVLLRAIREMADEEFMIGSTARGSSLEDVCMTIADWHYNPGSTHSHILNGSHDDASEVVVSWTGHGMPHTPYQQFILFGDGETSLSQLTAQAKVIERAYEAEQPEIVILTARNGLPLQFGGREDLLFRTMVATHMHARFRGQTARAFQRYFLPHTGDNPVLSGWKNRAALH